MRKIDIKTQDEPTTEICYSGGMDNGEDIELCENDIMIDDYYGDFIKVPKKDVPALILALQKAVELGWLQ